MAQSRRADPPTAAMSAARGHQLPVPAQERLRADHEGRPARSRQRPAHNSHEAPVAAAEPWPPPLPLEHHHLMAEYRDLRRAGHWTTGDEPNQTAQRQIDQ